MDLQLKGKTALVFGGSKGIGRGIAEALAAEGVAVAIVARTQETIDRTVSEMTARGGRAIGIAADLANWSSIEVGVKPEVWEAQFHAMVMPFFRVTDLLIGEMRMRKFGRILNVASYSVIEPIPTIGISNTLRSAVVGWAKTLAGEVARDGVTVNMLLPGVIATDRSKSLHQGMAKRMNISEEEALKRFETTLPVGRMGTAAEFGAVAAFLASPLAAYVTGSMIRIDGGLTRAV